MSVEFLHVVEEVKIDYSSINRAFSKQAAHYDEDDLANPILQSWRKQVYDHVQGFLKPSSHMLELNSGTGIDAIYFVRKGHHVHCTDLSDGMIRQIQKKIELYSLQNTLSFQQCSFDHLAAVEGKYDYVFSNFGGLNCIEDLTKVIGELTRVVKPGGVVTWVIMPPVCPWEISWLIKGHFKNAFRRLHKNEVIAHLEGEYFKTYYHSLGKLKRVFGKNFRLLSCVGLGALSPPPSEIDFPQKHPGLYKVLNRLDKKVVNHFPFNRWADHIIVTFEKA